MSRLLALIQKLVAKKAGKKRKLSNTFHLFYFCDVIAIYVF